MLRHTHTHTVNYEDEMQYVLREEYTATLNTEALERLPPEMRAVMDLDFLAWLTNTDSALLQKYKVEPRPSTDEQVETIRSSPSYISLGSVHVDLVKQAKTSDRPVLPVLKRHSTYISTIKCAQLQKRKTGENSNSSGCSKWWNRWTGTLSATWTRVCLDNEVVVAWATPVALRCIQHFNMCSLHYTDFDSVISITRCVFTINTVVPCLGFKVPSSQTIQH